MEMHSLDDLSVFVTPSILLSSFILLTNFFGKIILREIPFREDNKTNRAIVGSLFLFGYFSLQLLIWWLFTGDYWNLLKNDDGHWIIFLLIANLFSSFFMDREIKIFKTGQNKKRISIVMLALFAISIVFSYATVKFIIEEKFDYLFASLVLLFSQLMTSAEIFSLAFGDIVFANIFFMDEKKKTIKNCRIIADSKEEIIIKQSGKIVILNRNIISKIEILDIVL
jgi:hypothetical protein